MYQIRFTNSHPSQEPRVGKYSGEKGHGSCVELCALSESHAQIVGFLAPVYIKYIKESHDPFRLWRSNRRIPWMALY